MASKYLLTPQDSTPEQICFADYGGTFTPDATDDLTVSTPTQVALALASITAGSYRQSAKFDLGTKYAALYQIDGVIEMAASVAAGKLLTVYIGPSPSATAANANLGGLSGSDAAYTGYSGSNADDSVRHLIYCGGLVTTTEATTTLQRGHIGYYAPTFRYGSLVFGNGAAVSTHSSDTRMHIVMTPVVPEAQ